MSPAAGDQLVECRFCGLVHLAIDDRAPRPSDFSSDADLDAAWARKATEHDEDCAWILERKQESSSGQ